MTGGTRIVAGIDEAGLGPVLGPMTLGCTVLRLPLGEEPAPSEWKRLATAVTRRPASDERRLVVADSKVVFDRTPRGHARLERTSIAFLGARAGIGVLPASPAAFFEAAPAELRPHPELIARHPWYARLVESLPAWTTADEMAPHCSRLGRALERSGVSLVEAFARLVPAGELNASFAETDNKALTTWRKCADLIAWIWRRFEDEDVELTVDRQGGRLFYAALLWEHLPDTWIETRSEGRSGCQYVVHGAEGRCMHVLFRERADEHYFAVALASCLAKYLRELSMGAFNTYFCALQEGLRPTAGYFNDGLRWLEEAREAVACAGLEPGVLVRER